VVNYRETLRQSFKENILRDAIYIWCLCPYFAVKC
jgi:hypothetical protein